MARRSSKSQRPEKDTKDNGKVELHQGYLPDGSGGDMAPITIKEIDDACDTFTNARAQVAMWEADKKEAREQIKALMEEHSIEGSYFRDYGGVKYEYKITSEPTISVTKVKEDV